MKPEHPQRTYLRRRGRMTDGQSRALTDLSARYCLNPADLPDWPSVFERQAPMGLEIGFGMGHALINWGTAQPDWNLVGIEVYQPGIGSLLHQAQSHDLENIRVLEGDANEVLARCFAEETLNEVRIFFPDPWPKKRHAKRRLLQPAFVRGLAERLCPRGRLWFATDWAEYAQWAEAVISAEPLLQSVPQGRAVRGETRFEQRGRRLGHEIYELYFERV